MYVASLKYRFYKGVVTVQYSLLCYDFPFVLTIFSKFREAANPIAPAIKFANSRNSHMSRTALKELRQSDRQAERHR